MIKTKAKNANCMMTKRDLDGFCWIYGGENQIWVHRVEVVPFRFDDNNSSRSDVVPWGTIRTTLVYC